MILNNLYIKFFLLLITILDYSNKLKIIKFFKKKIKNKKIILIDIGAHKGETINLFSQNFKIKKIFAFEANTEIFNLLKKKLSNNKIIDKLNFYNVGLGEENRKEYLQILKDTSSTTFNKLNTSSQYYRRKEKYLSLFKKNFKLVDKKILTQIKPLSEFAEIFEYQDIDILKIDTEGFELNILKGIKKSDLKKIKLIYVEHHYDLMIKKNYKFQDLKRFFDDNNFELKFKIKMKFRKVFEYIYENKKKIS